MLKKYPSMQSYLSLFFRCYSQLSDWFTISSDQEHVTHLHEILCLTTTDFSLSDILILAHDFSKLFRCYFDIEKQYAVNKKKILGLKNIEDGVCYA